MYDWFITLFSEELLSQGIRVGGVLYLPVYALFEEVLTLLFPAFFCMLIVFCILVVFDLALYCCRILVYKIRNRNK